MEDTKNIDAFVTIVVVDDVVGKLPRCETPDAHEFDIFVEDQGSHFGILGNQLKDSRELSDQFFGRARGTTIDSNEGLYFVQILEGLSANDHALLRHARFSLIPARILSTRRAAHAEKSVIASSFGLR